MMGSVYASTPTGTRPQVSWYRTGGSKAEWRTHAHATHVPRLPLVIRLGLAPDRCGVICMSLELDWGAPGPAPSAALAAQGCLLECMAQCRSESKLMLRGRFIVVMMGWHAR